LAGGRVAVNDALRDGLVQRADRLGDGSAKGVAACRARGLDRGTDLRADGAVAHATLLALAHALHSRPRVRHVVNPPGPVDGHRASCRSLTRISNGFSEISR